MTLTAILSNALITDNPSSPGFLHSRDVATTEPRYEDPLWHELLSTDMVSWAARIEVPERGRELVVRGTGRKPAWLRPVLESLAELLSLDHGWDSYDASPISPDAAVDAIRILLELSGTIDFEIPIVVPTSRGGIQLEWQRPGVFVELEVSPGAHPSFIVEDAEREEVFEGSVARSLEHLRTALAIE